MPESTRVTRRTPARASHGDALTRRIVAADALPVAGRVDRESATADVSGESTREELRKDGAQSVADEHIRRRVLPLD